MRLRQQLNLSMTEALSSCSILHVRTLTYGELLHSKRISDNQDFNSVLVKFGLLAWPYKPTLPLSSMHVMSVVVASCVLLM